MSRRKIKDFQLCFQKLLKLLRDSDNFNFNFNFKFQQFLKILLIFMLLSVVLPAEASSKSIEANARFHTRFLGRTRRLGQNKNQGRKTSEIPFGSMACVAGRASVLS